MANDATLIEFDLHITKCSGQTLSLTKEGPLELRIQKNQGKITQILTES